MCRAWVNFNGTGTVAIRASGNVSSITDNGTGVYTVNFTTAMVDVNYSVTGQCTTPGSMAGVLNAPWAASADQALGSIKVGSLNTTFGTFDHSYIELAIFR
jgi:hypothetical protein